MFVFVRLCATLLVVEIVLDHVARLSTIGTKATSRVVSYGLRLSELTILVVVGGGRIGRKHRDGGAHDGGVDSTSGGGSSSTIVRAVRGGAGDDGATLRTGSSSAGGHKGSEGGRHIRCVIELGSEWSDGRRRLEDPSSISIEVAASRGASLVIGGEGGGVLAVGR
jgi:hypothetical protein